jgi:hypothetical protein
MARDRLSVPPAFRSLLNGDIGGRINESILYIYIYIPRGKDDVPPQAAFDVPCPYPPGQAQPGAKTTLSISSETREQALSNDGILALI